MLLLSYVRKDGIKGITEALRTTMDEKLPEKQVGPVSLTH